MDSHKKDEVSRIVDGKLSPDEMEELVRFLNQMKSEDGGKANEPFFQNLALDVVREIKEMALMILDFRRSMSSRISPDYEDITTKFIPETTDQLETVIESTEKAANKVMDNLETMQADLEKMRESFASLKEGKILPPGGKTRKAGAELGAQTIKKLRPVTEYVESSIESSLSLISDIFVQMTFQDLTGQRIKRIISLVGEMEEKIKGMVVSLGVKISEHDKNPHISEQGLQKAVEERFTELAGPQKEGQGLDQAGIDEILAGI